MGSGKRNIPTRLGEKLKAIREELGLTTEEMIVKLNSPEIPLHRASITQFEKGRREPQLIILLKYARLARISVDVLIDDEQSLPINKPIKKLAE